MTQKHLHRRDEPIVAPDLPLIDTHHHLYIRPNVRYMLPEFLADIGSGHDIRASVHGEKRLMSRPAGPEHLRHLCEVEFATGLGDGRERLLRVRHRQHGPRGERLRHRRR